MHLPPKLPKDKKFDYIPDIDLVLKVQEPLHVLSKASGNTVS